MAAMEAEAIAMVYHIIIITTWCGEQELQMEMEQEPEPELELEHGTWREQQNYYKSQKGQAGQTAFRALPMAGGCLHRFGKSTLKVIIVITSRIASSERGRCLRSCSCCSCSFTSAAAAAPAADVRPPKNINSCPFQKANETPGQKPKRS